MSLGNLAMKSNVLASGLAVVLGLTGVVGLADVAVAQASAVDDRKVEADRLFQQGIQQFRISEFEGAFQSWRQALKLYREIKDRLGEGQSIGNLGIAYDSLGNYPKAIDFHEQRLVIARELKDQLGEGKALGNLGSAYRALGNYPKAIDFHEQSLAIAREAKDRHGEGKALGNLGLAYYSLGNYPKAIDFYEQSLVIAREIKDRLWEGQSFGNLGNAYLSLGNYPKAIEFQEQRLAITREIKDRRGEGNALGSLGIVYYSLGNYPKALDSYEQHLVIAREIKDRRGEESALGNLGNAYDALGNYPKAIQCHEKSLAIAREIKDRSGEGQSLGSLGNAYLSLGNYPKAIEFYDQWLSIAREIKDRSGEGSALGNLGNAYNALGNYPKAIGFQEQYVVIAREIKDRRGEWIALNNLGLALRKQEPELAIVVYKQSVNVSEGIRKDNRKLDQSLQSSYTKTVARTYRDLADLLIQRGRITEAQEVLELLKVQELNELDPKQRANPKRLAELALNPTEQEIQKQHNNLIAFGEKVRNCTENCQPLETQQQQLNNTFKTYLANLQKTTETTTLVRIDDRNKDFIASASKIVNAQPGTVLIYPLVLPDKTHLLWASQGGILSSVTCPMGETKLNATIAQFQASLTDRTDLNGVKQHGKTLYDCLIKPLEEKGEWQKNNIKNLVIAADRTINYIPIAALHDGKQFLIEKYATSNILNAGLTDVTDRLPKDPTILGIGISAPLDNFSALPNVETELNTIIRTPTNPLGLYPGNLSLNQNATPAQLKTNLKQPYNILHIATHGQFNPTEPNDSFLLFSSGTPGKGDRYTINRIDEQQEALRKIHLVILSACQSATGQSATTGIEIQGLSAAFVRDRAKSVIASLWNVDDASTALLMQQFYKNLTPGTTKAQALQKAQLQFILGNLTAKDAPPRAGGRPFIPNQPAVNSYLHPYYWAPFLLIGNSQ